MSSTYKSANIPNPSQGGGGGGGGGNPPYSQSFIVATWQLNGGVYEITIPAATHGRGINLHVQVFENIAGNFELVDTAVMLSPTGNVTLTVGLSSRFAGKVIIQGE